MPNNKCSCKPKKVTGFCKICSAIKMVIYTKDTGSHIYYSFFSQENKFSQDQVITKMIDRLANKHGSINVIIFYSNKLPGKPKISHFKPYLE